MIVKILPNDRSDPPNKLADAELLFEEGVLTWAAADRIFDLAEPPRKQPDGDGSGADLFRARRAAHVCAAAAGE